ncbi:MAG: anthranilate phosphoribosyltransferase [Candidatus Pelagibacter sp.]|nr:anthranilate phosphoribosyltransferase [Candidatus Pelagibacter sp.]OUV87289.1 MAG: anthranilate phosphoribosyltransferase [Pelagibacteraceae bacterium TMED136]|tara:strand:- start:49596 stop:50594 length:999 start_codon:yes stop_codon:yes gene_type:complete
MKIENIISKTSDKKSLNIEESKFLFQEIMNGKMSDQTIKEVLVNLSDKGESVEEITGGAIVLKEKSLKVNIEGDIIDTCGTGGDEKSTINISTASALVLASMGHKVAKHGNRSISSKSGSADVLEMLNINIDLNPKEVEKLIYKNNFAFMFAPKYHSAMKNVATVRKELKKRTIFNLLGPLCNPAKVNRQCIGVFSMDILEKYIKVLKNLKLDKAWVFHSYDGLDEISIFNKTKVYELKNKNIKSFEINPSHFIETKYNFNDIVGGDAKYNSKKILEVFKGNEGALLEIISLNVAAGLIVLEKFSQINEAYLFSKKHITSGKVYNYYCTIKT